MKNRKYIALAFAVLALVLLLIPNKSQVDYRTNEGKIHGTYYHITYLQPDGIDLQDSIEAEMRRFEQSLSAFDSTSVISRINRNEAMRTDSLFEAMFEEAMMVSELTGGAFDITVAPLVNAWGFGFRSSQFPSEEQIDSIRDFVGYTKVALNNHTIYKDDPRIMLDAGAIAKGYSVDVVAQLLSRFGCENYLVEIGGEVACRGKNPKGKDWSVGISKPEDNPLPTNDIQQVLRLTDRAVATSGNYRQFYYRDGKKYSHTIDPRTGYPVNHNLLSATIVARSCMHADALATACMVLGVEEALQLCENDASVEGYFIYSQGDSLKTCFSSDFEKYMK